MKQHTPEKNRRAMTIEGKGSSVLGIKEDQCRVKERNNWIEDQPCIRQLESGQVEST
jgi:hypothetical protein